MSLFEAMTRRMGLPVTCSTLSSAQLSNGSVVANVTTPPDSSIASKPCFFANGFDSRLRVSDQSLLVGWLPGFSLGRSLYSTHFSLSGL